MTRRAWLPGVEVLSFALERHAEGGGLHLLLPNPNTDFTEKFFVRVDVTEEFPFLVTKLSPYHDR